MYLLRSAVRISSHFRSCIFQQSTHFYDCQPTLLFSYYWFTLWTVSVCVGIGVSYSHMTLLHFFTVFGIISVSGHWLHVFAEFTELRRSVEIQRSNTLPDPPLWPTYKLDTSCHAIIKCWLHAPGVCNGRLWSRDSCVSVKRFGARLGSWETERCVFTKVYNEVYNDTLTLLTEAKLWPTPFLLLHCVTVAWSLLTSSNI